MYERGRRGLQQAAALPFNLALGLPAGTADAAERPPGEVAFGRLASEMDGLARRLDRCCLRECERLVAEVGVRRLATWCECAHDVVQLFRLVLCQ